MDRSAGDENLQIVTLHFDVPEHYLNIDEFVIAARSTEQIIDDLNAHLFKGKLKYEIVVLPPEAGSLKERLGIKVTTVAALIFFGGMIGPEFASGFIKGLTGKSVFELGEIVGGVPANILESAEEVWDESLVAVFLAEATQGFFQTKTENLEKCGVTRERFSSAYEGRNKFYESCYRNPEIAGIGFDDREDFPIKRNDFNNFIVEIPERREEEDNKWEWEITYIKVVSPNWDRADANRAWKAKYIEREEYKEAYFNIEDDAFWRLVEDEQLTLKGRDSIKVQWAYQKLSGRRRNFRVLKVLEYNGAEIAKPLTDEELLKILEIYEEFSSDQIEMFH